MTNKVSLKQQQREQHYYILDTLERCMDILIEDIDRNQLDDEQYQIWVEYVDLIHLATTQLRDAILTSINAEYADLLPSFKQATTQLENEIENMEMASDIIKVASAVTGSVTSMISLLE